MKKITKKAVMDKVNADNPVVTAPLIDKLSAVVDLKDAALCGLAFSGIIDWLNDHEIGKNLFSYRGGVGPEQWALPALADHKPQSVKTTSSFGI